MFINQVIADVAVSVVTNGAKRVACQAQVVRSQPADLQAELHKRTPQPRALACQYRREQVSSFAPDS
jgi:hypothetical protein